MVNAQETDYRWEPSEKQIAAANLTKFLAKMGVPSYTALLDAVAADIRPFNEAIVDTLDLRWDRPWDELLDLSRGKEFATWFRGAEFNIGGNCIDRWIDKGRGDVRAILWEGEDGTIRTLTYAQVQQEVKQLAGTFRGLGIEKGDAIGIFMPLIPETAIAMLAIAYAGAIAVPAFSGYGPQALATRLSDSHAKLLLTVDGVLRRGKPVGMKTIADEAVAEAPGVKHVLVFNRAGLSVPMTDGRDLDWKKTVALHTPLETYERTSANDPVMLLYTSGSTGKPKGVVHVHAGFPLKAMIDQHLCMDMQVGDRMLWFTDIGWMMGPWLIYGALGVGGSCVLYEGTPDWPKKRPAVERLRNARRHAPRASHPPQFAR